MYLNGLIGTENVFSVVSIPSGGLEALDMFLAVLDFSAQAAQFTTRQLAGHSSRRGPERCGSGQGKPIIRQHIVAG